MARAAFFCTLGQDLGSGAFSSSNGAATPVATPAAAAATAVTAADDAQAAAVLLAVDVATAVGVLVADGASPTQAHVNDLNTAWGLFETAFAAVTAATAAAVTAADAAETATGAQNAVFDIDTSVVTTQNAARAALRQIEQAIAGSGMAS